MNDENGSTASSPQTSGGMNGSARIGVSGVGLHEIERMVGDSCEEALKLSILVDHFFGLGERALKSDGQFSISSAEAAMLFGQACEVRDLAKLLRDELETSWANLARGLRS